MSESSSLTRTGSAYAGAVAVQVLIQAASLPVLTRLLNPDDYGLTATALVVANMLAVVLDLGLARAVTRAWFRTSSGPDEAAALVLGGLGAVVALSLLTVALVPVWGGWLGMAAQPAVRVAAGLAGAMAARNVVLGLLRAASRSRTYVVVMLLGTAGGQLAGLALAAFEPTAVGYLAGLAGGSVAGLLVGLAVLRPSGAALGRGETWRWGLRFALPLLPGELAGVVIWFSDRIVIERQLGLEEVARYQIAYTLGSILLMLAMGVSQAWAPIVYAAAAPDRLRVTDETRARLLRLASYAVAAVSLAGPLLLVLLIPREYRPSGLFVVTALVALSVLPLITQQAATHFLSYDGRTSLLGRWGIVAAVLNVLLNLALVPVWELPGSALATLLTYVFYAWAVSRSVAFRLRWQPWIVASAGAVVGALLPVDVGWGLLRVALVLVVLTLVLREVGPLLRRTTP